MEIIYKDLIPDYIPFVIQCSDTDGSKVSPVSIGMGIYEESGDTSVFDSDIEIFYSGFDEGFSTGFGSGVPQINDKTGLRGWLIAKSNFDTGKVYRVFWEVRIGTTETAKEDKYLFVNSSDFKG